MKKNIFYNKSAALGITLVIAVLSIFLGGANGLASERIKAVKVYENGWLNDGVGIANDLIYRANNAYGIASTAALYLPENERMLNELKDTVSKLIASEDIVQKRDLNVELTRLVAEVYNSLQNKDLAEKDKKNTDSAYREIQSRGTTISRDKYNSMASDYNLLLEKFPASLIKSAGLAKTLPSFTGTGTGGN